jgi:hypothetical protein
MLGLICTLKVSWAPDGRRAVVPAVILSEEDREFRMQQFRECHGQGRGFTNCKK